jgi:glutaconate CoA-transferase, subunit A
VPGGAGGAGGTAPRGPAPSYTHGYYARDNGFYQRWDAISRDRDRFQRWIQEHVMEAAALGSAS